MMGSVVAGATGFLRLNADDVDRGVGQASAALDRLTDISRNSYFGLRNIGVAFEAIGDAAVAAIGLAAVSAGNWEQSLAEVDRTNAEVRDGVIQNTEALGELHNQLTAIISIQPTAPGVIGQIAAEAGALGVAEPNVARFTDTVSKLLVTTDLSQEAATVGLARIAALTGATADQYDNLGSTIVETGRNTQATESQIVDIATRFAGIGASFGLTKSEIVGVSAALASVGLTGRIGVTALQRTFQQMSEAISEGGTDLQNFAAISGVSVDQFSQMFHDDAYGALQLFVSGLGDAINRGQDLTPLLGGVNLTQQQVVRTLRQLALAQSQVNNDAQSLSGSVRTANDAFRDGNALQQQAQRMFGTTSNQIRIMRNDFQIAAISFGSLFLPVIRLGSQILGNFALGLAALPTWARASIAVMAALAGIIGVVGGAILLLLPRFLIARDTLIQLAIATQAEAAGQGAVATATAATVPPMQALVGMMTELVAIQLVLIGEYETLPVALAAVQAGMAGYAAETGVVIAANAAETVSIGVLEAAWITLQAAMGPIGWIMLGITAVVATVIAVIGMLGKSHRDAAESALANAQADQQLIDILERESGAVKQATADWIIHKLALDGTLATLQRMGVSTNDVVALVQGNLPQNRIRQIADDLHDAAEKGDEGAKKALKTLTETAVTYAKTVESENALTKARNEGALAASGEADAIDAAGNANLTAAQKADRAAQAAQSYASDLLQEKSAALQVKEAQDRLAEAADNLRNKELLLADANQKVAVAQAHEQVAADKLVAAQRTLARARTDAQKELTDAIRKQESDELQLQRAVLNVQKSQNELNKVMDPEESADKLRDAYNSLRNAQLDLIDANQAVSDSQWYVNYLMGEGASARDIADANRALDNARQKVADQTDKVSDAERELRDVQNGGESARRQADAEIALKEALLAVTAAQSQIADQQRVVNDLRADVAADVAYHTALEAERSAQEEVSRSKLDTTTALRNLHAIQNGSVEREFAGAQIAVEQAVIQHATAVVNLKRDWDEMHGIFWDSRRYAKELGDQLVIEGSRMSGPVRTDIMAMGNATRNTTTNFNDLESAARRAGGAAAALGPNAKQSIDTLVATNDDLQKHAGIWEQIGDKMHDFAELLTGKSGGNWLDKLREVASLTNPFTAGLEVFKRGWEMTGHDTGGLFTKPHIAAIAETGPELILPLQDQRRTMELLQSSGVADMLMSQAPAPLVPVSSGGGGVVQHIDQSRTVHQGNFNASIQGFTDLDEAMREWSWEQRISSRSA